MARGGFGNKEEDRVSLSDVATQVTLGNSSLWELIKWTFTRPHGTRISRKAALGGAVRLLIYLAEFLILFGSIPRTIAVYKNQVPGTTEISVGNGVIVTQSNFSSIDNVADIGRNLAGKWCGTDNVELLGFTPTAIRLVCMTNLRTEATIKAGKKVLGSNPRFSTNNSHVFALSTGEMAGTRSYFSILSARSGTMFLYSHSLTFRTRFGSKTTQTLFFPVPRNILDQAVNLMVDGFARSEAISCEEIELNTNMLRVVSCTVSQEFGNLTDQLIRDFMVPLIFFWGIGTRKVTSSTGNLTIFGNNTPVSEDTNIILGEVNRPRLCLIPALIVLAILTLFSAVSRIWLPSVNVTLQLWKWFSMMLDSGRENPLFVSREKVHGETNVFDMGKSEESRTGSEQASAI